MKPFVLRAFSLVAFVLFAHPSSHAADTNPPPRLTVELRDGSRVIGTSVEKNLRFHSALLGDLKLAVKDIRSIECVSSNSIKLQAANGDVLALQFVGDTLALKTGFGKVELAFATIRKCSVSTGEVKSPQREGLIGFWPGNGNADDTTGGSNGTLMGGATFAAGLSGQVFNFDEPGSFVKIPKSPALDPGSRVTIEFWMKPDAANAMDSYQGLVTTDFYGVEISNGYGGNMGVNFFLNTAANQSPMRFGSKMQAVGTGFYTEISDANNGGAAVSAGQWHHVAATYDGTQLQLFIDGLPWGKPMAHSGRISPMSPESFVAVGSEDGRTASPDCIGNRYFKGQLGKAAIYNRALTPAEIREDFEADKPN